MYILCGMGFSVLFSFHNRLTDWKHCFYLYSICRWCYTAPWPYRMPDNCCFPPRSPWSSFCPALLQLHFHCHPPWQPSYWRISRQPFCLTHRTAKWLLSMPVSFLCQAWLMSGSALFRLLSPFRWPSHSRQRIHHCRPLLQPGFSPRPLILQWQARLQKLLPLLCPRKCISIFYL